MYSSSALPTSQMFVNLGKLLMSSPESSSSHLGVALEGPMALLLIGMSSSITDIQGPNLQGRSNVVIRNVDSGLREGLGLSPASSLIIWGHDHPYNDDVCPLTMNKALCWVHWEECIRSQRVYEAGYIP